MPISVHRSSSGRDERNAGEYWFCTETRRPPRTSFAWRIWSGSALEMPAIWMTPSSSRSRIAPNRLLVGDRRVGAVELVEPDGVDAEALRGRLGGLLEVLGAAVLLPACPCWSGCGRPWSRRGRRRGHRPTSGAPRR